MLLALDHVKPEGSFRLCHSASRGSHISQNECRKTKHAKGNVEFITALISSHWCEKCFYKHDICSIEVKKSLIILYSQLQLNVSSIYLNK